MDENTLKQIEEIIVDEEGTHRIGGKNESDHNTILLTIDTKINRDKEKRTVWKTPSEESWNNFNKTMKNRQDNIKDYQSLSQNITEALKVAIGTRTVGVTNKRKESKQTKILRQDKNKLKRDLQSAIQRKDPEKTTILKKYINSQKILREQLENEIRVKTRDLADKLIETGGAKSKLFWQIRKRITNTKAKETYDTITEEGEILEDPTKTKNYIADFYENLYQAREGQPQYKQEASRPDSSAV